ncbi:hypothetical protein CA13_54640 [Planctomycetes bacterium CA13]|uniref:Uncharacterized protein n=1 Tax=Novipirellula herctigrandis TaxID=2527986 RepID=A0A5C5Z9W3_9BACT|nr:hypothetical protein CA13_54640 [Planctomycetes bacterium CA13]
MFHETKSGTLIRITGLSHNIGKIAIPFQPDKLICY